MRQQNHKKNKQTNKQTKRQGNKNKSKEDKRDDYYLNKIIFFIKKKRYCSTQLLESFYAEIIRKNMETRKKKTRKIT